MTNRELEEKSFNYWFTSNEQFKIVSGTPTTKEEKELLQLGYHFGFYNCSKILNELIIKESLKRFNNEINVISILNDIFKDFIENKDFENE